MGAKRIGSCNRIVLWSKSRETTSWAHKDWLTKQFRKTTVSAKQQKKSWLHIWRLMKRSRKQRLLLHKDLPMKEQGGDVWKNRDFKGTSRSWKDSGNLLVVLSILSQVSKNSVTNLSSIFYFFFRNTFASQIELTILLQLPLAKGRLCTVCFCLLIKHIQKGKHLHQKKTAIWNSH